MKNNSIIYEPDFIILNKELFTSLCVYFDELILVSKDSIEEELYKIEYNKEQKYIEKSDYIKKNLLPLSKEGIITVYSSEEVAAVCPKSMEVELGDIDISSKGNQVIFDIKSVADNEIAKSMIEKFRKNNRTVYDLLRFINVYSLAMEYNIPILKDNVSKVQYNAQSLSDLLAMKVLCRLAVPQVSAINCEDIIKVRKELKDELIEFRAGILDLTYLLHQSIQVSSSDTQNINQEIDMLIDTKVKSSVLSLERKLIDCKKNKLPNIVLNGGKFLISGALLAMGLENKNNTLSNGVSFLQSISDINASRTRPEDKIASYIISLNERF